MPPEELAYQKAHIADDRRADIIIAIAVCLPVAYVAVILRIMSRRVAAVPLLADDWTMMIALVWFLSPQVNTLIRVDSSNWSLYQYRAR